MVLSVFPELLIRSLNIKPNGAFIIARGLLPRYIDIVSMYISKRHVLARANAGYTHTVAGRSPPTRECIIRDIDRPSAISTFSRFRFVPRFYVN